MATPTTTKIKKFVDTLYEAATQGGIEWSLGFDETTVETRLGKNIVHLSEEHSEEGDDTFVVIRVKNENGDVLDTIYPGTLHPEKPSIAGYPQYWQLFESLFAVASRSARGVEKVMDDLISELEKKTIPF